MEPNNERHVPRPSHHGNPSECGGGRGLGGHVFILICVHRLLARRLLEDATRRDHVSLAWAGGVISAGNCDDDWYSHNHLERFCSWSNMPVSPFSEHLSFISDPPALEV